MPAPSSPDARLDIDPAEAAYSQAPAPTELPSRPPAGDPVAGPVPGSPAVRAICCSGGGIRSAAFSLGGLQQLNATEDGPGRSWYGNADLVCAVSGGSYVASAYAVVQHGLVAGTGGPPAYAPGSPEDNRLRAHTRYLVDSKTQLGISLFGVLYGLIMNLVPVLAVAYVLSNLAGWVIGQHGLDLLVLDGGRWTSRIPPELGWAVSATVLAGLAVYFLYRLVDVYHPLGDRVTTIVGQTALALLAAGAGLALVVLAVPWVLQELERWNPETGGIDRTKQVVTFAGTLTGLLGVLQQLLRRYNGRATSKDGSLLADKSLTAKVTAVGKRVVDAIFPWLGAIALIALVAVAMLTWTWNVVAPAGGRPHWGRTAIAVAVVLGWQMLTDVNRTSLHRFYTQRLATAFAVTRSGVELDPPEQPLSRFTTERDKPALVVCATVNTDQTGVVPTGRDCAPFTFSAFRSGISSGTMFQGPFPVDGFDLAHREQGDPATGRWLRRQHPGVDLGQAGLTIPTATLEQRANGMTLMDMVGVSGAAVSPAMGRMTRPSLRLLLAAANIRLGMWLPNPAHPRWSDARSHPRGFWSQLTWQARQPGLLSLFREMTGAMRLDGAWIYVTDGGHYENLGLVEALRRGASEIIVFDASGDQPFGLGTFAEAVETARADLGVEIRMDDPAALAEVAQTGRAAHLAARCTATYANGVQAVIYLCKAAVVDGLPPDLLAWKRDHPDFPNTSTADQLYGDREFEAYRRLGQAAAEQAMTLRTPPPAAVPEAAQPEQQADLRTFAPAASALPAPPIRRRRSYLRHLSEDW